MTCSSRSTSAVGPDAMSRPKSSTAVVAQHADTRLMSWSTRITSAPVSLGDPPDDGGEVLGLLVGQAGGRLVEQHEPRLADDRPGDLDEAALAGAERADRLVDVVLEADEGDGVEHVVATRRAGAAGLLVDEQHVVEDRQVGDGLLGLERAPHAPAGPPEVGHRQQVVVEGRARSRAPAGRSRSAR